MTAAPVIIEDVWAQCENANCEKWRRLPPGTQLDETKKWFCSFNPDPRRNSCTLPEEDYDQEAEINSQYFEAGAPIAPIVLPPKPVEHTTSQKGSVNRIGSGGSRATSGTGKRGKRNATQTIGVTWADTEHQERQRWDSQIQLEHAGFQKLMQRGGTWEMAKGSSTITAPLPPWLWDGMAAFAPELAELACESMDVASAAAYFQGESPQGARVADTAASVSRLVTAAAAAVAGIASTSLIRPGAASSGPAISVAAITSLQQDAPKASALSAELPRSRARPREATEAVHVPRSPTIAKDNAASQQFSESTGTQLPASSLQPVSQQLLPQHCQQHQQHPDPYDTQGLRTTTNVQGSKATDFQPLSAHAASDTVVEGLLP